MSSPPRNAAFSDYFTTHYGPVLAFFVRRVDDQELARDLTAEVFRLAWVRFATTDLPSRAWLLGVARNLVGDEYRRRQREREGRAAALPLLAPALPTPNTQSSDIADVVEGLPERHRDVLKLAYWDGLSGAEIADHLNISLSAVWVRLHRARKAFAAEWTESELEHPGSDPKETR